MPGFNFLYEFLPTDANYVILQKPLGLSLEKMIRLPYKIWYCFKNMTYISVIYLTGRQVSNIFRCLKDLKATLHGVKHHFHCIFKRHSWFFGWTWKYLLFLEYLFYLLHALRCPQCQLEGQSILTCPVSPTQCCANSSHVAGAGWVPTWAILLHVLLP